MRRRALAWGVLALTFFSPAPGESQPVDVNARAGTISADTALEARTSEVAATLRCPVCQGESIQDSPAALAQQMRAVVREKLRAGETPEQIRSYFVARYGEWILLEPTMTGLNIALYALPILLVMGGLVLIVILVRRWTRPLEGDPKPVINDG